MNGGSSARPPANEARRGLVFGLAAYGLWGVLPTYFKSVQNVPSTDIVAHRVVWSLPFIAALLSFGRGWPEIATALRNRRTLGLLLVTSVLIGANWLLYVYAVNGGHILAGSLGYYLNPLANVLLGRFILKERLVARQWVALAIAGVGIAAMAAGALGQLWISLALCLSFATYGLLRKIVAADALAGLAIETAILAPLAICWLAWSLAAGRPAFGSTDQELLLLTLAGIVSTTPLLLFTAAARRLRYSTLGMLQFIAPTLQFLLAVLVYGEAFTMVHAFAFGCIWTALALYLSAILKQNRAVPPPE